MGFNSGFKVLICLLWWIWHFVKFITRDFVSKFNKYFKIFPY